MSSQTPSEACCSIPPAVVKDYTPKGKYIELPQNRRCYVTGPADASSAILYIFDIFGFSSQVLQGADMLAYADSQKPHRVYMPDMFFGKPMPLNSFPPDTEEKKKALGDFFAGPANPPQNASLLPELIQQISAAGEASSITRWAGMGMCWGGKVIALTSAAGSPFKTGVICHPAMVDPADASKITIPFQVIASKDEDGDAVQKFGDNLKTPHQVDTFHDHIHGFMAARADIDVESNRKAYEKGYSMVLHFLHQHL